MKNLKKGDFCWKINTAMEDINSGDYDFLVQEVRIYEDYSIKMARVIDANQWDDFDPGILPELNKYSSPLMYKEHLFPNEKKAWEGLMRYYETKIEELASLHSNWIKASIIIQKLKNNYEQKTGVILND